MVHYLPHSRYPLRPDFIPDAIHGKHEIDHLFRLDISDAVRVWFWWKWKLERLCSHAVLSTEGNWVLIDHMLHLCGQQRHLLQRLPQDRLIPFIDEDCLRQSNRDGLSACTQHRGICRVHYYVGRALHLLSIDPIATAWICIHYIAERSLHYILQTHQACTGPDVGVPWLLDFIQIDSTQ